MLFLWPFMLWTLTSVPVIILFYLALMRRHRVTALRYASLSMVREAVEPSRPLNRHVPPLLLLGAISIMFLGMARPAAMMTVPRQQGIIILAMDISGSMAADDILPSRMHAARAAASEFVNAVPATISVALVAFNDTAALVQPPTTNHQEVLKAIERLNPTTGTAIGSGLVISLRAIYEVDSSGVWTASGGILNQDEPPAYLHDPPARVPAAVVLLTDGENTAGPAPQLIAPTAARHHIPIYTVGLGKPAGTFIERDGQAAHTVLDVETLKSVANITGGTYSIASNETDLRAVYQSLRTRLVMRDERTEITALFAGGAGLLTLAAAFLSMFWLGRPF